MLPLFAIVEFLFRHPCSTLILLVGSLLTCKNRLPYNLYCVGGDVKHCSIHPSSLARVTMSSMCVILIWVIAVLTVAVQDVQAALL